MLQNAYFLAKIGADTAENEQHFAENLPKNWDLPYGSAGPPCTLLLLCEDHGLREDSAPQQSAAGASEPAEHEENWLTEHKRFAIGPIMVRN